MTHNPDPQTMREGDTAVVRPNSPLDRLQAVADDPDGACYVGDVADVCHACHATGTLKERVAKTVATLTDLCAGKRKGERIAVACKDIELLTDHLLTSHK